MTKAGGGRGQAGYILALAHGSHLVVYELLELVGPSDHDHALRQPIVQFQLFYLEDKTLYGSYKGMYVCRLVRQTRID